MQNFTDDELVIINKIVLKNGWCDKLISRADLLTGREMSTLKLYEVAIDTLAMKGIFSISLVGGRKCYCLQKIHEKMIYSVILENPGKCGINFATLMNVR